MTRSSRWIGTALLSTVLGAAVVAQTPVIDIKMGLWENTVSMTMAAGMPPRTTTSQDCMTKEKLEKEAFGTQAIPGMTCKSTVVTNTKTTYDAKVDCTGDPAMGARTMKGDVHVQAESSSAYKATMKMSTAVNGQTMAVDMTMTGKWLGASCGTVK